MVSEDYLVIESGPLIHIANLPKAYNLTILPNGMCMCPWCNGYRRRKWTRRHEFKPWTRLIAFLKALIPLGKV